MGVTVCEVYPFCSMNDTIGFFSYRLATQLPSPLIVRESDRPRTAYCLNPHSFYIAEQTPDFKQALLQCDILLPDGIGICQSIAKYKQTQVQKIAGDDLHRRLLEELDRLPDARIFYLGSSDDTLNRIRTRLATEHPSLCVGTFAPPFADQFSDEENQTMVDAIERFAPDVLLVGMTAPKQELWIDKHRAQLHTPRLIAAIGAVFDYYSGTTPRAPQWAIDLKVEWAYRLLQHPQKMWRRTFVSTPRYLQYVRQHHVEM